MRFFWLKVQGSMKSCNIIMIMCREISSMVRVSGRPHAWPDRASWPADLGEPATEEEDHRPSRAPFISRLKSREPLRAYGPLLRWRARRNPLANWRCRAKRAAYRKL